MLLVLHIQNACSRNKMPLQPLQDALTVADVSSRDCVSARKIVLYCQRVRKKPFHDIE